MDRRTFLGAMGSAVAMGETAIAQAPAYTLEPAPSGKTLKAPDGKTVFSYLTEKPPGLAGNSACCFHPLNTPSGECVTAIAPADHPDHRGLFFAWLSLDFNRPTGKVSGDFWGWGHYAPTEGRVIVNRDVRLVTATSTSADLLIRNDWKISGEMVMTETVTVRTTTKQSARVLDLVFHFESDSDVSINQVAFSGLCLRSRKDGRGTFSNKDGVVSLPDSNALKPETDWPGADWYSYTVGLENGKTITAAVIDHPQNPPSAWHEPRPLAFLNPCISAPRDVKIPAGKPLVLRYRVVAQDGEASAASMNSLAAEWRAAT